MASRGASSLAVVVLAHLLSARAVSGDDKPRPRWELKDKPSVWESAWRHCEDSSGGSSSNASGYFSVQDVVPSPGSFAGRTGHSGSTKFTVDTNGKRVEEASRARASFFPPLHSIFFLLCLPDKKKATEHVSVNSCRRSLLGTDASSRASCVPSLRSPQGRVSRRVSYEGHSSAEETVDLCEWTEDCPLGPGQITFAGRRLKVPWYSPPGSYKYRYALHDRDGSLLLCAEIDLR